MMDARDRLLKPGGVMIPESVALVVAAAHITSRHPTLPAGIALNYDIFESLAMNIPVGLNDLSRLKILSTPRELLRADLTSIAAIPVFSAVVVINR